MWEMDDTDDKISSTNLRTKKGKRNRYEFSYYKNRYILFYIHNSLVMHLLVSNIHSGLDGIIILEISLGDVNYSYCHVT